MTEDSKNNIGWAVIFALAAFAIFAIANGPRHAKAEPVDTKLCAVLVSGMIPIPFAASCHDQKCARIKGVVEGAQLSQAAAGSYDEPGIFAALPPRKWIAFDGGNEGTFCMSAVPRCGARDGKTAAEIQQAEADVDVDFANDPRGCER